MATGDFKWLRKSTFTPENHIKLLNCHRSLHFSCSADLWSACLMTGLAVVYLLVNQDLFCNCLIQRFELFCRSNCSYCRNSNWFPVKAWLDAAICSVYQLCSILAEIRAHISRGWVTTSLCCPLSNKISTRNSICSHVQGASLALNF